MAIINDDEPAGDVNVDELGIVREPKESAGWLALITQAEVTFSNYQTRSDAIDKLYADLNRQAAIARDREFAVFWSNCEVLKPSIYARPPIPVVVPKFKDRRPIPRVASELLERSTSTAFDLTEINQVMLMLRDDLTIVARGAAWVRYETGEKRGERICVEHIDRKDFLHDPARVWAEVDWVARRAWMTRLEMRDRFQKTSGDAWQKSAFNIDRELKDRGGTDNQGKAAVWEIWCKSEDRVVWVTEGVEELLDDDVPHLKLEGFFPCPRPAYGTVQRRSLVPVPDMLYYKDQLEEINQLTARIHALADALQARGFYQAGGEIGAAVEAAMTITDDRRVMIPVSNMASIGPNNAPFVMLPIAEIAQTIAGMIEMRRSIIDDVYQIMGLSDIMRGSTEASETATAQNIKAQFGSVRIRDKQFELIRIARDIVRIAAEIMAENFEKKTLLEMSQMEIPSKADISKQVKPIKDRQKEIADKLKQIQSDPQLMQQAEENPEQAQQMLSQAQQQIEQAAQEIAKIEGTPTIEDVMDLLRDQKIRPFTLDIETDSTIQPDEDAEKARRTEFMGTFMQSSQGLAQMIQMNPGSAPLAGELLKFAMAPFRVGRTMEGAIDDFVDQMVAMAGQPQPNPEAERMQAEVQAEQARQQFEQQKFQMEQQAEAAKFQAEQQAKQQELATKAEYDRMTAEADAVARQQDAQIKARESDARLAQIAATMARDQQKAEIEREKMAMDMKATEIDMAFKVQQNAMQSAQSAVSFEQQTAMNAQKANKDG